MAQRTGGSFWQDCANSCGRKAQASLTPKGKPILCRVCQIEAKKRGLYLEQPTKAEKQAFIAAKSPKKVAKPRQVTRTKAKAVAKATAPSKTKPRRKRPAAKAA